MLTNLNTSADQATFLDTLFNFLVNLELPKSSVYLDSATPQRATIGIGFNLTNQNSLNEVLGGFGFSVDQNHPSNISLSDQLLAIYTTN